MKMKNTLTSLALAALAVASTPALADFVPFTVNETGIDGNAYASSQGTSGTYAVDNMTGKYGEMVGLTSATTFSASAVGSFTSYANGSTTVSSALNKAETVTFGGQTFNAGGYKLYAVFLASGTATSSTKFAGNAGELRIYVDTDSNTNCTITSYTALATCTGNGDDQEVGFSTTSAGTGDLIGPPGAFNIYFTDFTLTAFGATYWTGIDTLQFALQTNGDIDGVDPNPTTGGLPPFRITGDFSANFATVPEPASLALVGVGLFGAGMAARRRKNRA